MMSIIIVAIYANKRWNDNIIEYDTLNYYGYLPCTFIYKDLSLNFSDQNKQFQANKISYSRTKEGKKIFKSSMGVAIGYLPFFLLAHGYANIFSFEASGFSTPYKFVLVWAAVLYAFVGLLYLRKILRIWFSEGVVSLALITCVFATNLYHYIGFDGTMSHVYSFAAITGCLWHIIQWHQKPTYQSSIIVGLLFGWIFLIRPINLLVVFIFLGWGINNVETLRHQIKTFLIHWKKLITIALLAFIFCIPQFIYWKTFAGSWLFYSYVGEKFYFLQPHILEGLFSWRKGWLLYTPVMTLSLAGIFFIKKRVPQLSTTFPIFMGILLYITWCWWCWWYGGSFGQRSLVDWYGLFSISIACLIEKIKNKKLIIGFIFIFVSACIYLNIMQDRQYKNTSVHYDSMTRKAYFYRFFSISKYPGLTPLLNSPDYEKALKGEKEYFWE